MTDAPERIKAWVTRNGVTEWEAGSLQFPPDTEVEYIRADLADAHVQQVREALEEMTDLARALTSKHVLINGQYVEVREAISRARAALADVKGGE